MLFFFSFLFYYFNFFHFSACFFPIYRKKLFRNAMTYEKQKKKQKVRDTQTNNSCIYGFPWLQLMLCCKWLRGSYTIECVSTMALFLIYLISFCFCFSFILLYGLFFDCTGNGNSSAIRKPQLNVSRIWSFIGMARNVPDKSFLFIFFHFYLFLKKEKYCSYMCAMHRSLLNETKM